MPFNNFLKADRNQKIFFVRDVYLQLFEYLKKQVTYQELTSITITGNKMVGKTNFVYYLISRWCCTHESFQNSAKDVNQRLFYIDNKYTPPRQYEFLKCDIGEKRFVLARKLQKDQD